MPQKLTPSRKTNDDLKAVTSQAFEPNKSSSSSTKRILLNLARAQHKVPSSVPDNHPILISIVFIEKQAQDLTMTKVKGIDNTLFSINEDINRIGTAGTRTAVQLQNKYTQEVGVIKGDFKIIAGKQDDFTRKFNSTLSQKDETLHKIVADLTEEKKPDILALKKIENGLKDLTQQSQKLTVEENSFYQKLNTFKTEVNQTANAVMGPSEAGPRPE